MQLFQGALQVILNTVERVEPQKVVLMVSKFDHTLLHLLYQIRVGWLDAEIAAIRGILTAEQRVQFDKNVATMKERMEKRQAGMREGRGQRGPRGARAPQGLQRRG